MKPSSFAWAPASSGTSTRGPYCPLLTHRLLDRLHPGEHRRAGLGVEGVVLAGGAGQVPGVHEDVAGEELRHGLGQRDVADVPVAEHPVCRGRVVEDRLHLALEVVPGAGGVVVHRRSCGQVHVGAGGEEGREPLDEVAHHVTRGPLLDRRGVVPLVVAYSGHDGAEPAADLTELLRWGVGHVG